MSGQRIRGVTSNRQKTDEKAAALDSLQEMFSGSLEPSVVNLILSESDYNVEDAIEKLITLANGNPETRSKQDSLKSSTMDNESTDGNVGGGGRPAGTKFIYDSIDDIGLDTKQGFHESFNPKGHIQSGLSHVGRRLVDSADNLVNSCISSSAGTHHVRWKNEDVKKSELSEPFKQFVEDFMSANSDSNEWSSTKRENQTKHSGFLNNGLQEIDVKMSQEEGLDLKRTSNRNSTKNLDDISKTGNSVMSSVEETKNEGSTTLPSWPDTKQAAYDIQSQHHHPQLCTDHLNAMSQNTVQYHPKNLSFIPNGNYRPQYQQFQPRSGYAPFVNQAFHIPRYQVPRHYSPGNYGQVRPTQGYASQYFTPKPRNPPFQLPSGKVLVIMRGLPGSGKSSFARSIKGNGVIYSTDDFFIRNGQYQFDIAYLGEAHEWNQVRAREAMQRGISPVIIDNTNVQAWQMRPYVSMAQRLGYQIILKEPDTPWKWNARELFKRNQHGVSLTQIRNLMDRYEHNLTIEHVLKSTSLDTKPREEMQQKTETKFGIGESGVHEEKPKNTSKQQMNSGQNERRKYNETQCKQRTEEKQPMAKKDIQFSDRRYNTPRNNTVTKRKVNDLSTQRSHGSRSPVQEFEQYMADERQITENNAKPERCLYGEEKTSSPKPQRVARKRERKTVEKCLPVKETELQLKPLNDNSIERVGVMIGGSSTVEVTSEEGSELSDLGELYNQQDSMDNASRHTEEDHDNTIKSFIQEREITSCFSSDNNAGNVTNETQQQIDLKKMGLEEIDVDSETENRDSSSQLSTQSTTDDAYASDDEESDDVIVESDDDDKDKINSIDINGHKNGTCDFDIKIINDVSRNSPSKTKEVASLSKTTKKTEREEMFSTSVNSSEDSESDMTGFEFLNTCFPDIDDQILVSVLSDHTGDVNKAIETILSNMERYMGGANSNSDPANGNSSSSDNNSRDDILLKPSQRATRSVATKANQGSFQMSIEPVVAFHLFEMFGPIDGVNMRGEFSDDDLSITVDMEFSKLLYQQWKKSIQKKKGVSSDAYSPQQARSPKTQRKQKQRTSIDIHDPLPPPPKHKTKPTDLREIMHEQLALEQSRHELDKRESDNNLAVVLKRQKLYAMFPGVDPSALEELFQANRHELEPTVAMVQESCNIQAKPTMLIQDEISNDDEEDWRQFDFLSGKEGESFQALDDPGYLDFRGEANMHYKLRDECFKKAAVAFAQKQGQLAQFYAAQGHLHTQKIKEANERAAARILEHKNADNPFALDLHGLHVPEALQALEERLNPPDAIYKPKFISVVTGRGLHSKQGKAKIKPAVLEYLQRNNYRYEEMHAGQLKVFLK